MRRRWSTPHTFEDRIAAEKARLEAQLARVSDGPKKDELLNRIAVPPQIIARCLEAGAARSRKLWQLRSGMRTRRGGSHEQPQ